MQTQYDQTISAHFTYEQGENCLVHDHWENLIETLLREQAQQEVEDDSAES